MLLNLKLYKYLFIPKYLYWQQYSIKNIYREIFLSQNTETKKSRIHVKKYFKFDFAIAMYIIVSRPPTSLLREVGGKNGTVYVPGQEEYKEIPTWGGESSQGRNLKELFQLNANICLYPQLESRYRRYTISKSAYFTCTSRY